MARYCFLEMAVGTPLNRNQYFDSKEVIQQPFRKENRFKEYWRSMFLYDTNRPTEESPMLGNFYLESDQMDFSKNRDIMIDVAEYLHHNYEIPYDHFDFFYTNRSIWISIPAKTFSCYGTRKLNQVYKLMAEEVNEFLKKNDYVKPLDTTIYKWNGLMHSLGSYLSKSKRWVSKFTFYDLERFVSPEELIHAKYENGFNFEDIKPVEKATQWFNQKKEMVFKRNFETKDEKDYSEYFQGCQHKCMSKLETQGLPNENRNLHIYTYSLYLKALGYSFDSAVQKIKTIFSNPYIEEKECLRTIKSAILGKRNFSCKAAKSFMNEEMFDCENCSTGKKLKTFLIPRKNILKLQESKSHYHCYKFLMDISYSQQALKETFKYSLKSCKHKKLFISYFEKLKTLSLIDYKIENDVIYATLIWKEKKEYQSHIVVPVEFIESFIYQNMKSEIKALLEIWRSSMNVGTKEKTLFFNVRLSKMAERLHMKPRTLFKYMATLKKLKLVFKNFLFVKSPEKEFKRKVKSIVLKIKRIKLTSTLVMKSVPLLDELNQPFFENENNRKTVNLIYSSTLNIS